MGHPHCHRVGKHEEADDADDTVVGLGVRAVHLRAIDHNRVTHKPCRRAIRTVTYFISKTRYQKQGLRPFFPRKIVLGNDDMGQTLSSLFRRS